MSPSLPPLPKRSQTFPNSLPDTSARTSEHHCSPSGVTMAFLARSVLSLRRNQVVSMDHQRHQEEQLHDLELFQTFVADRLLSLLSPPPPQAADAHDDHFVTFSFLERLLDVLVSCGDEFKSLLLARGNPGLAAKPPADRLLSDLLDRAVKSLDICSAVRNRLHSLRRWNRNADIAASAVPAHGAEPPRSEGHLQRAKKALANLLANQTQERSASMKPDRACSRRCKAGSAREENSNSNSSSWSALKEVQAMSSSLTAPPTGDPGGGGLAVAAYTMSSVLVFAMWALVAAFPWQERSTSPAWAPTAPPKQLAWAAAMSVLQERIAEEWRGRGRREGGILVELLGVEKCGKELMDSAASGGGGGGGMEVVVRKAAELARASRRLEEGLGPFDRHVWEAFHRVVESRAEVMTFLEQSTKYAPPFIVL